MNVKFIDINKSKINWTLTFFLAFIKQIQLTKYIWLIDKNEPEWEESAKTNTGSLWSLSKLTEESTLKLKLFWLQI